jgi:hypothetical protein
MGASLSLAAFAALVAAITVVASMTVLAAVGLLYYSAVNQEQAEPFDTLSPNFDAAELGLTMRDGPVVLNELIDARKLVGFFDEEESSLSSFDPLARGAAADGQNQFDAAYGTPEWTEEEGATEIFSANSADEAEAAFADFDEKATPLAADRSGG